MRPRRHRPCRGRPVAGSTRLPVNVARLGADLGDVAHEPQREVDQVGAEVGDGGRRPSPARTASRRDRGVEELVGQPRRPEQAHVADPALVDEPLHQGQRRQPPVVEPDGVRTPAALGSVGSAAGVGVGRPRAASRRAPPCRAATAASTISACVPGGVQTSTMSILGVVDDGSPVGHGPVDAVGPSGSRDRRRVAAADHAAAAGVPAAPASCGATPVAVRVGAPHHPVADDPDADVAAHDVRSTGRRVVWARTMAVHRARSRTASAPLVRGCRPLRMQSWRSSSSSLKASS